MGERVALSVSVCQHTRDTVLMQSLIQYFNCGFYKGRPGRD